MWWKDHWTEMTDSCELAPATNSQPSKRALYSSVTSHCFPASMSLPPLLQMRLEILPDTTVPTLNPHGMVSTFCYDTGLFVSSFIHLAHNLRSPKYYPKYQVPPEFITRLKMALQSPSLTSIPSNFLEGSLTTCGHVFLPYLHKSDPLTLISGNHPASHSDLP